MRTFKHLEAKRFYVAGFEFRDFMLRLDEAEAEKFIIVMAQQPLREQRQIVEVDEEAASRFQKSIAEVLKNRIARGAADSTIMPSPTKQVGDGSSQVARPNRDTITDVANRIAQEDMRRRAEARAAMELLPPDTPIPDTTINIESPTPLPPVPGEPATPAPLDPSGTPPVTTSPTPPAPFKFGA